MSMDTGAKPLQMTSVAIDEIMDVSNAKMPLSPNTTSPPPTPNPDSNPWPDVDPTKLPVIFRSYVNTRAVSTKTKTPSIERYLSNRHECFWPVESSTTTNGSSTLGLGTRRGLLSAFKSLVILLSSSTAECILGVLDRIGKSYFNIVNTLTFGFVAWGKSIAQTTKETSNTERTVASASLNIIKTVPLPQFPIRVFFGKPPPFCLETQKRKMRWRYRWRFGLAPEIIQEPNTQQIEETVRQYIEFIAPETETISVELLGQGAFNQAYNVAAENKATGFHKEYVFRVALPIYPHYKLESDVATTEYIRHTTTVPVPTIYAFDSYPDNKLGFEWMLMEKVKGVSLHNTWDTMEYSAKQELTRVVADWVNQISCLKFDKIGSLYCRQRADQMEFYIGPTLNSRLYEGDRLLYDLPRGPFDSIHSYFDAVLESTERHIRDPKHSARHELEAAMHDGASSVSDDESSEGSEQECQKSAEEILAQADEKDRRNERQYGVSEDDLEWLPDELRIYRDLLPKLCLPTSKSMTTILTHPDLSAPNIFVDESGAPVALIDWERARIEPIALVNPVPHFLTEESASDPDYFYIPSSHTISTGRKDNKTYLYSAKDLAEIRNLNERTYMQVMERIQETHLRALYRAELKRLQSPIYKAFERDAESLEQQLISRVYWPERAPPNSATDWAAEHLGE